MLRRLGISPSDITDVVLTHGHWDHVGGVTRFPEATVWMSAAELEEMQTRLADGATWNEGYRLEDLRVLSDLVRGGRLREVRDEIAISRSVRLVRAGGHTPGMLAVVIGEGGVPAVVLAGDNAYLYRNLEEGRAISRRARAYAGDDPLPAIRKLAGKRARIVPGHDPAILERYPAAAPGVAKLLPAD
jgi:glyoxylase-like metal-dependent hydrolase (beta-lactamase superfamily II)